MNKEVRRRIILPVLLLAVLFVGCLSPKAAEPADDDTGPANTLRFGPPVALPQNDHHGAEPSIAILDDGTLFITAMSSEAWKPGAVDANAWLWRSRDGGSTWERLRGPFPDEAGEAPFPLPGSGAMCSCDPHVVTSPDGWVYYTDWWLVGLMAGNYRVEGSADGGETWNASPITTPVRGGPLGPYSVDRQWLMAGEDGFVMLVYHQEDTAAATADGSGLMLQAVYSRDHGATWDLPITIREGRDSAWEIASPPQLLPDGRIITPLISFARSDSEGPLTERPAALRMLASADKGATWTVQGIVELPDGVRALLSHAAAVDDTGRILVAYNAKAEEGVQIFIVESTDGGETWSAPTPLTDGGFNALPWVTATDDGRFAAAWYHADWDGDESKAPAETEWYVMAAERGRPDVEWVTGRVDETPVHLGPMCFDGAGCGARPLRDYLGVAYGPNDSLHVTYTRSYVEDVFGLDQFHPPYGKIHYAQAETIP